LLPEIDKVFSDQTSQNLLRIPPNERLPEGGFAFVQKSRFQDVFILMLVSSDFLQAIERQIGIGYLVQNMGRQPGIEFIAMQAPEGIVFASRNIEELYRIETDPFLQEVLELKKTQSRVASFQGRKLLEVVKPFESSHYPEGIFRIGLSLDSYNQAASRFTRQTVLVSIVILLAALLVIAILIVNQQYLAAREALQKSESLTASILESMNSAVLAVDSSGGVTAFNRVAAEFFSVSRHQTIGEAYSKSFPKDEWLISQVLYKKMEVRNYEFKYRIVGGEEKNLLVSNSGIYNKQGKLQGAISVIHDITDLKRLEEESKRSERLSALGNLAAGVAHEIRNPLNAIAIAAQRLKTEFKPTQAEKDYESFLKSILSEIKRLDQIVNQFLSLARSQKLNLEPTDTAFYLADVLDLVKMEAEERKIRLVKRLEEAGTVNLDRQEMKKALLNIILNGIQAMEPGGTLTVETRKRQEENVFQIAISDTGKGISAGELTKIFQPYFSTKEKGSGLGLAIAHRIVSDHKGKIEVKSEMGKGTSFIISLPVEKRVANEHPQISER
jgi:PAS domain S-box-containing protein